MEQEFTPGLLSLNMNIMHVLDIQLIYDEIEGLKIRQEIEHSCVSHVLQNMIAILKTKSPRERLSAKDDLELILKIDPNNLNALADLGCIYRGLHRFADADRCRSNIENITKGSKCKQYKAICLMEQGYAVLHDMSVNIENIANSKLTDAYKMLQAEHQRSQDDRKEILRKCVFHNKQAISNLDKSINCRRQDAYSIRKIDSIQKFQQASEIYDNISNKNVWAYYIGEAWTWNRHVDSLKQLSVEDNVSKQESVTDATCKALEMFFQVLDMNDDTANVMIYVSRSLAHIGHILIKRVKLLNSVNTDFKFICNKTYLEFCENPMLALEKAYEMQKRRPDTFVLNRYGRALFNLSFKNNSMKRTRLEMAEYVLDTSINSRNLNWFAYSTRMVVTCELSDVYLYLNKMKAWSYLEKARRDGHQCFISKGSATDMNCLAKICQKMAKFPYTTKYGVRFVNEKRYLFFALDYLHYGLSLAGPYDHQLANTVASCLFDLDEIIPAAEWMKRVLALSTRHNLITYKLACLYQLKRYGVEREQQEKPYYLIREITYLLLECERKGKDVSILYEYIVRNAFADISNFIMDITLVPNLLRRDEIDTIQTLLKYVSTLANIDQNKIERLGEFQEKIMKISPMENTDMALDATFENSVAPIPIPTDSTLVPDGFEYNFFVSHSKQDIDWVTNVLLFELENKLSEEDLAFKGCIDERDFKPGKTIIANITDAIKKSYKIILVLTKHFVSSRWCKDEMEKALVRHINKKDCVIPLLLEPLEQEELPDCLSNITYLDVINLTDENKRMQQMTKLKEALLPGC